MKTGFFQRRSIPLSILLITCLLVQPAAASPSESNRSASLLTGLDASAPASPVKLIFIHHSTGENWLTDGNGDLGIALRDANYVVSDTNYGWGPSDQDAGGGPIGDHTDVGNYYSWFAGPHRDTYLSSLFAESGQHAYYSRLGSDP